MTITFRYKFLYFAQGAWATCSITQGPVARSPVSANRWLRGIKTNRFPWYLSLVSANHASSNPGLNNRPFPSSCLPFFQIESQREVFVMVISSTLHMN